VDEDEFDFEIYDDDDFYHQLLRELIEKRTGEGGSNQIALGRSVPNGSFLIVLFTYYNNVPLLIDNGLRFKSCVLKPSEKWIPKRAKDAD